MKRPIITGVMLDKNHVYPHETIKIIVDIEEIVFPIDEPKMYSLPFILGDNQGGGF